MQARSNLVDQFAEKVQVTRPEHFSQVYIYEENTVFANVEVEDDQTFAYSFLVLTYEILDQLREFREDVVQAKSMSTLPPPAPEEEQPWYGTKKYGIVDHVLT